MIRWICEWLRARRARKLAKFYEKMGARYPNLRAFMETRK